MIWNILVAMDAYKVKEWQLDKLPPHFAHKLHINVPTEYFGYYCNIC